ncbi:hypothetical protein AaE_006593 [Aphanomyces astaci]|uniref:Uncharacterized protein n=1 Tax=Aphanomyces astaci TaxID=112090 RepID=A0A6A4ZZT5_APHAT|nr:hypothetical protein AaE_006593 [Aphanomyces astaci]
MLQDTLDRRWAYMVHICSVGRGYNQRGTVEGHVLGKEWELQFRSPLELVVVYDQCVAMGNGQSRCRCRSPRVTEPLEADDAQADLIDNFDMSMVAVHFQSYDGSILARHAACRNPVDLAETAIP